MALVWLISLPRTQLRRPVKLVPRCQLLNNWPVVRLPVVSDPFPISRMTVSLTLSLHIVVWIFLMVLFLSQT